MWEGAVGLGTRLSGEERARIAELAATRLPSRLIARELGRSHRAVWSYVHKLRRPVPAERRRSPLRLSLTEREEISRGVAGGESFRVIAGRLGRAPSTISREVASNGDLSHTRPSWAIHTLTEGDLLYGKRMTAIATLVERYSRFVMLVELPNGHSADVVAEALAAKIVELPHQLRRSITWNQGKEMAAHARFSVATGVPVHFCDPRSPWQRGSNENTNGLLRQYFPKRSDLAPFSQHDLDAIAAELNKRPRQTLGWMTPSQALDQALR
jgi:IS30 family transposase